MAQSSCRESKGLWTDKNNWEKQATLIASATCAAFPHNGFIYKSSSKVLQDKLILMLMSIMMRNERYAMWSWSMPPWILGNLLLGPSAVMCTRKKGDLTGFALWMKRCSLSLSLSFPCSCVFSFFFYWEIKSMRWCSLRHAGLMMKERALLLLSCAGCVRIYERVCASFKSSY